MMIGNQCADSSSSNNDDNNNNAKDVESGEGAEETEVKAWWDSYPPSYHSEDFLPSAPCVHERDAFLLRWLHSAPDPSVFSDDRTETTMGTVQEGSAGRFDAASAAARSAMFAVSVATIHSSFRSFFRSRVESL